MARSRSCLKGLRDIWSRTYCSKVAFKTSASLLNRYAVFWRATRAADSQRKLVWGDGHYERAAGAPSISGFEAMDLLLKHFKGELVDTFTPPDDAAGSDDEEDEEEDEDEDQEDEAEGAADSAAALLREKVKPRSKRPPLLVPCRERAPPVLHWCGVSFGATPELLTFWLRLSFELCYLRQTANDTTGEHTAILLCDLGANNGEASSAGSGGGGGASVAKSKSKKRPLVDEGFPSPASGWLSGFVADARRRLVSLLSFTFRGFTSSMALSLLGGGSASLLRPRDGFASGSHGSEGSGGEAALRASELGLFLTAHDLRRLDLYSRNMADHHLVTDLLPPLAKLFFLGHLNGTVGAASGGGAADLSEGGLSLSMVQKALLLGVGLQHRSVESLGDELGLPVSQVNNKGHMRQKTKDLIDETPPQRVRCDDLQKKHHLSSLNLWARSRVCDCCLRARSFCRCFLLSDHSRGD